MLTSKTNGGVNSYSYTYYYDGNRKTENGKTYTYDKQGRLKTYVVDAPKTLTYNYDKFGNRASAIYTNGGPGVNAADYKIAYSYGKRNELLSEYEERATHKITNGDELRMGTYEWGRTLFDTQKFR